MRPENLHGKKSLFTWFNTIIHPYLAYSKYKEINITLRTVSTLQVDSTKFIYTENDDRANITKKVKERIEEIVNKIKKASLLEPFLLTLESDLFKHTILIRRLSDEGYYTIDKGDRVKSIIHVNDVSKQELDYTYYFYFSSLARDILTDTNMVFVFKDNKYQVKEFSNYPTLSSKFNLLMNETSKVGAPYIEKLMKLDHTKPNELYRFANVLEFN